MHPVDDSVTSMAKNGYNLENLCGYESHGLAKYMSVWTKTDGSPQILKQDMDFKYSEICK